jgi:hypothetical protein
LANKYMTARDNYGLVHVVHSTQIGRIITVCAERIDYHVDRISHTDFDTPTCFDCVVNNKYWRRPWFNTPAEHVQWQNWINKNNVQKK